MAAVLLFDTLKFSKRLINAGVPVAQAEETAEALKDTFEESLKNGLASKKDIKDISKQLSIHDWMLRFLLAFILAIFAKIFF